MFDKVCYRDGWHYSVITDENGYDEPDQRLVLEDGEYRLATDEDTLSWHDLNHKTFTTMNFEGKSISLQSADELAAVEAFLAERRG